MEQCQPFNFWNSTLLQTIVTAIVGLAAFAVYKWQKNDQLRNAATMLLLEIRQAQAVYNPQKNLDDAKKMRRRF